MEQKEVKFLDVDSGLRTIQVDMTLHDIWGGDGNIISTKEKRKTTDKKVTMTKTISEKPSYPKTDTSTTQQEEENVKEIHTFKIVDGKPVLDFGRKLHGVMIDIAEGFVMEGNKDIFPQTTKNQKFISHLMNQIRIEPKILVLTEDSNWRNNGNFERVEKLQPIKNRFGEEVMLTFGYDCIKEVKTAVTITFPKKYEEQIKMIISRLPLRAGDFNKHGTTFSHGDISIIK